MYSDFFRNRLAELRIAKGVSARTMSTDIGLTESYINKIENGKALPSMDVFFKICEYLSVSPKEFFDDEETNPDLLRELSAELKRLNDRSVVSVIEIVKKFL